ncbi:sugar ABC transporter permease [Litorilinea aerophila]|uniref:Sugar ABC transporter permease n=1 Tax=Litorilinea aerophila TaxID=1204385 RepID=A0A540VD58_9CHLR|nr:sugar ABC transporter permease [Litorilinea aerophila]MCC9077659.1 sugar ABC transporter permease [Litorilinea aerophila]
MTTQSARVERVAAARSRPLRTRLRGWIGYVFIAPWLISFLAFDAIPIVSGFYHSFTDWNALGTASEFLGWANYQEALTRDPLFWTSVGNTIYFIGASVPLGIVAAFVLALMLNAQIRGTGVYRTIYYLPSVVPTVAAVIVWIFIFETRRGILNYGLELLGLPTIRWLSDPNWAMPALIIMSLWTIGAMMIIFLAGLQGIPQELYEAAEVDGANGLQRLLRITVPLMTPTIFFNLVMNLVGAFQAFNNAFIMTGGGPHNATLLYMLHLYNNAFRYFRMGYASALAVMLFVVVFGVTFLMYRTSDRWVHYH